jgi:hypothetical protein
LASLPYSVIEPAAFKKVGINLTQTTYPIPKNLLAFLTNTSVIIKKYNRINIKTYANGSKLPDIFYLECKYEVTLGINTTYKYSKKFNHCICCVNKVESPENILCRGTIVRLAYVCQGTLLKVAIIGIIYRLFISIL